MFIEGVVVCRVVLRRGMLGCDFKIMNGEVF